MRVAESHLLPLLRVPKSAELYRDILIATRDLAPGREDTVADDDIQRIAVSAARLVCFEPVTAARVICDLLSVLAEADRDGVS